MRNRVVKHKRLVVVNPVDKAVQSAENNRGFAHLGNHRLARYRKRLKGDIQSPYAAPEKHRSVNSVRRALNGNLRQLFELAVNKKAVLTAVAVVTDAACKVQRKPLSSDDTVRA